MQAYTMTATQAASAHTLDVSPDGMYSLAVSIEAPDMANPGESVTDWVGDDGEWHTALVYYWICKWDAEANAYTPFEFCHTSPEAAYDLWELYYDSEATPVGILDAIRNLFARFNGVAA